MPTAPVCGPCSFKESQHDCFPAQQQSTESDAIICFICKILTYAWPQATSAKHYGEKDARLEYLSWRVWFMKRKHALAKEEHQKRRAAGLVEDVTQRIHDEETSDEEPMLPATSTGSKGVAFHLPKKDPALQKVRAPVTVVSSSSTACSSLPGLDSGAPTATHEVVVLPSAAGSILRPST
jgi:hypothetical protein